MKHNFTKLLCFLVVVLVFSFTNSELKSEPASEIYELMPNISTCTSGKIKQSTKDRILKYVNDIRAIHKLDLVTYATAGDNDAQEAALICTANGTITHTPPTNYACYSAAGYKGCETSNLYIYMSSGQDNIDSETSIDALMIDENVPSLGHRLSIINPFLTKIAFGRVDGRPKSGQAQSWNVSSMTLKYQDYVDGPTSVDYVAYPQNNYPTRLFDKSWFLSFSAIANKTFWGGNFQSVNFLNAKIKVEKNGQSLTTSEISFNNNGNGSMGNCLQWKVAGLQNDTEYDVTISNVLVNGTAKTFTYKFNVTDKAAAAPSVPVLTMPADKATKQPETVSIACAKVSGADNYDFEIKSEDNSFNSNLDKTTDNSFLVEGLTMGTKFLWRARANNSAGSGAWSSYFTFTTAKAIPTASMLLGPENNKVVPFADIDFQWSTTDNTEKYEFQISNDIGFFKSNIFVEVTNLISPNYIYKNNLKLLKSDNKYYWRVRGSNSENVGEYSDIFDFRTDKISGISDLNYSTKIKTLSNGNYIFEFSNEVFTFNNPSVEIFDFIGNTLNSNMNIINNTLEINFNLLNLSSGTYIIKIMDKDINESYLINFNK